MTDSNVAQQVGGSATVLALMQAHQCQDEFKELLGALQAKRTNQQQHANAVSTTTTTPAEDPEQPGLVQQMQGVVLSDATTPKTNSVHKS